MINFIEFLDEAIAVDKVNTTPGKKEVVVLQGRFQPPQKGHLKAIEAAYKKYKLPVVIVLIKGAKSEVFFDSKIQKEIFEKMVKVPHQYLDLSNGFVGEWINELRNAGFEPKALFCGSDRVKSYQGQIKRYTDKLNLDIKVEEIARTGKDVSASKVREALKNDDIELFKANMDKSVWGMFDLLKKKI